VTWTIPRIARGRSFLVRSRRGTRYECRLIRQADDGLIVRLADGRLARLNPAKFDWDSLELKSGGPVLQPGDMVEVEMPSGALAGELLEPIGDEVALRLPGGAPRRLPRHLIEHVYLVFRSPDLRTGDRFRVKSRSGNRYRGEALYVEASGRTQARLDGGATVTLHQRRLDLNSLEVLVPVEVGDDEPEIEDAA
jgi:hypothetical protein